MVGQVAVELVESLRGFLSVKLICKYLGIPRSTYYRWKKERKDTYSKMNMEQRIGVLCRQHKYRYGYRKITALLRKEKLVNHKVVQRVMQKYNWQCRVKVKKRKRTGQPSYIAENILNRNFEVTKPLQKLVTDITYLPFGGKQLYLSSIIDLFNGEVIAYSIGEKQDTSFVLETLSQLKDIPEGCVLHSDQGSVYTSYDYQQAVKAKGITMSMSRKGTPADNAPIESFHASLKSETFYLDGCTRTTTAIVIQTVQDYINYYNNTRIQTKLNNQSPIKYRELAG